MVLVLAYRVPASLLSVTNVSSFELCNVEGDKPFRNGNLHRKQERVALRLLRHWRRLRTYNLRNLVCLHLVVHFIKELPRCFDFVALDARFRPEVKRLDALLACDGDLARLFQPRRGFLRL